MAELNRNRDRVSKREDVIDKRFADLDRRESKVETKEKDLETSLEQARSHEDDMRKNRQAFKDKLATVSEMSKEDAVSAYMEEKNKVDDALDKDVQVTLDDATVGHIALSEGTYGLAYELTIDRNVSVEAAVAILRGSGGCEITGENVRMGREFVMEMIARAPESWTITPRNPERQITIGGRHLNFGNVSSPPSYWDMKIGRKVTGTREMCQNLLKLRQISKKIP